MLRAKVRALQYMMNIFDQTRRGYANKDHAIKPNSCIIHKGSAQVCLCVNMWLPIVLLLHLISLGGRRVRHFPTTLVRYTKSHTWQVVTHWPYFFELIYLFINISRSTMDKTATETNSCFLILPIMKLIIWFDELFWFSLLAVQI